MLFNQIRALMTQGIKLQDALYDQLVLPNLETDHLAEAYQAYMTSLDHFDNRAFRRTLDLVVRDPEKSDHFAELFQFIPAYINHRNNFDDKRKELLTMDGTPQDKQAMFDALDRQRTRAHNGVIQLFNQLNDYAVSHGIAAPYPNNGQTYDPQDLNDRDIVAQVLARQETVLETINLFFTQTHESQAERFRTMGLKELKDLALSQLTFKDVNPPSVGLSM